MALLKKTIFSLLVILLISTGYFIVPTLLINYINRITPGVQVENAKVKNIDCVSLTNISINKTNIKGNINNAIACRNTKTINADTGTISIYITKSSGKKVNNIDKYNITAKNLIIHIYKDNYDLELKNASIKNKLIHAQIGTLKTQYGLLNIQNIEIDLNSNFIIFEHAKIYNARVGNINISNAKINTDNNKYTSTIDNIDIVYNKDLSIKLSCIFVQYINNTVELSIDSMVIFSNMLYSEDLSIENIKIEPFKVSELFTINHLVNINGIFLEFNITDKRIYGNGSCNEWLNALPKELKISIIDQIMFKGNLKFTLEFTPNVNFKLNNGCIINGEVPNFIKALSGTFKYEAYHPNSKGKFERISGPGSVDWIPIDSISNNMVKAITTTEDPGFFFHRGIIPLAIENSIKDNIRLKRFFRGGSTITMQLSKNLWLTRDRNIGRKIQEAILTTALESSLPKEKILELYFNIIEFGPDLYGIGMASDKLLGTNAANLSLSQALYLVLRLPSPSKAGTYEQMKGRISKMIDIMNSSGKVSDEEAKYEKEFLFEDFDNTSLGY